ncbi:MAG: DUF4157 domain-containing protein [Bacteroidota bacterium]
MPTRADKKQKSTSRKVSGLAVQKQSSREPTFQFADQRPEVAAQKNLQNIANNSTQVSQLSAIQQMADNHAAQQSIPIQKKGNNTGMPDHLKSGIENLSGYSMDDVKVHYNSNKPAQLQAHAYAQGTDIHIASGQEKHLPHEAWHVVQQKQGRVKPTIQLKGGIHVNDDTGLEKEADVMGEKAMHTKPLQRSGLSDLNSNLSQASNRHATSQMRVIQRKLPEMDKSFIEDHVALTKDILKHSIENMSDEEFRGFSAHVKKNKEASLRAIDEANADGLSSWYANLDHFTHQKKKHTPTLNQEDRIQPTAKEMETIKEHLSLLCTQMQKLIGQGEFLKTVFGPECDLARVKGVFKSIWTKAYKHHQESSAPVERLSEEDHNKWVSVEGMASDEREQVSLTDAQYQELLNGTEEGMAAIVHEFSHKASTPTEDIAYSLDQMERLPSAKRVENAESYAQAYLEYFYEKNQKRIYNKEKVVPEKASQDASPDENKERRISAILLALTQLYNHTDNAYSFVKDLHRKAGKPEELLEEKRTYIQLAIYPHKTKIEDAPNQLRGLIEDRTHRINQLLTRENLVNDLTKEGITKKDLEAKWRGPNEILLYVSLALAKPLYLSADQAKAFVENYKKAGFLKIK